MAVEEVIEAALQAAGVDYQRAGGHDFVAELPGERRLKTACWLRVGAHSLTVEAFVMRHPDENHEQVYAQLLRRNARMYAVSWAIDDAGDVYLIGRIPLAAVTAEEIDRVLGAVLDYSDGSFNQLLQLGFGSSIRREWAWREKNGIPRANLAAFEAFATRPVD